MTSPARPQAATHDFTRDLTQLMVRRGVSSIAPRPHTSGDGPSGTAGLLGLTEHDVFVTQDLAFTFLGPGDHRAAAAALNVSDPHLLPEGTQRNDSDVAAFSRDAGTLFDRHGVMNLEFPAGSFLGFRSTPQGMQFTVDGVHLTLRPTQPDPQA
ncbi:MULTISPECIES: hypothetical protein [Deinococcus]|nr:MULTISPECIES: hypothetical protein [Deinococcus]GGS39960.1 hypothetical protein GCM10008961_34180 [Deinococcus knuensis]